MHQMHPFRQDQQSNLKLIDNKRTLGYAGGFSFYTFYGIMP